ncbi:Ubiquitin thioesterase OTUB1 [Hypsizygus marmoreus]|uniref:ubiquitinyl hydrolase 1 n=1 Tax=Hypsizygus marmoreus TaxID=39966 RepID=A0A369JC24_HYPMA|nr:Ubiquitin thioesterase OTUB1 [Hypsizygus marmoreus]
MDTPTATPPTAPKRRLATLPDLDDDETDFDAMVVDENTDINDLTPAQMYDLNQVLFTESVPSRPLIGEIASLAELRAEYEDGSPNFVLQIDWLQKHGFHSLRRTKGDGDCFYRSTAFAFIEQLMNDAKPHVAVAHALSVLHSTLGMLTSVGFQSLVFDDFYDVFVAIIRNIVKPDQDKKILTPARLLDAFQSPETSNSIVVYLRLVTSAQMRLAADEYDGLLFHPETGEPMEVRTFCENFVEATGKEADHVQMTALARALQINIDIAYMDGRSPDVSSVPLRGADDNVKPLILLYRPGHYDILMEPTTR